MRTYLRARVTGGCYFFTVNLAERKGNTLLIDRVSALRAAFAATIRERPFAMPAIVVLPDHLHCLWELPVGDDDFPTRWRLIKSRFSRRIEGAERRSESRRMKKERGLWQRRYWEHVIRDTEDYRRHADYIHFNPVKHGYVSAPRLWPHSSFRQWVRQEIYPESWGAPE
ncbi:transposase [Luteimonas gilva]|uniref:Transposase n=1 Tax=Luteimonas gilva TaxID=2572684 RepID=A0A4U5JVA7_9GAMM|nr:transposase [Luteimonas gilva]TKR30349.1 transposase [Luteimonas gilva]